MWWVGIYFGMVYLNFCGGGWWFGWVKIDGECWSLRGVCEKCLKHVVKRLKNNRIGRVACCDFLLKNDGVVDFLRDYGIAVLNGVWLWRFLAFDVLRKISYVRSMDLSKLEVSILSNVFCDIVVENIKLIGKYCKVLNVVTDDLDKFSAVERTFFDEYGVLINVSSNRAKSLMRSDVVLNFDFNLNYLKSCNIRNNCILVQMNGERFVRRDGVTICSCKLNWPEKYGVFLEGHSAFSDLVLYESLVYSKISFNGMRNVLKRDCIGIRYFVGNNGKIDFEEIRKKT